MNTERDNKRVGDAYRDIATEMSPAHLDDRIMAMARQEARTRYGLARAWVRPIAWAATIALSFAFILEMTYFREDPLPVETTAPPALDDAAGQAAKSEPRVAPFKRAPATIIAAPEIKMQDTAPLRESEERVDAASAGISDEAPAAAASRQRASLRPTDETDSCDAEERQSAATWYSCVQALRERGLEDAARAELDALREAYPDFREPVRE